MYLLGVQIQNMKMDFKISIRLGNEYHHHQDGKLILKTISVFLIWTPNTYFISLLIDKSIEMIFYLYTLHVSVLFNYYILVRSDHVCVCVAHWQNSPCAFLWYYYRHWWHVDHLDYTFFIDFSLFFYILYCAASKLMKRKGGFPILS